MTLKDIDKIINRIVKKQNKIIKKELKKFNKSNSILEKIKH